MDDEELLDLHELGDEVAIEWLNSFNVISAYEFIPEASDRTICEVVDIVRDWAEVISQRVDQRRAEAAIREQHPFSVFNTRGR